MPDATVKTVKIEIQAEAKNAEDAVGKVTRAVTQLQNILAKDTGVSRLGQSINNAFKSSNSSIETQMKKVASLKIAMRGLSTLYSSIKSNQAALEKAEIKMEDAPLGSSKYEKAKAKVDELKDSLEYLHWQASEALDDNYTENAFVTEIIRTRDELKEEEAELRRLKKEERETASATNEEAAAEEKSGDAAKRAASSHKSFSDAMKKVGNTLKKVKSHIKSAMNGFKSIASSLKGAIPGANKFGGVIGKLANQFKRLFVMRVLRNLITSMIKGFKEGIDNVVKYSAALNGLDANNANRAMSELASTTAYLKNVLGSAAIPVLNAVIPLVRQLATAFATAVNYVNQFLSALSGKSSWTRAKQVTVDYASSLSDVGSSAGGAKDAVEDLKRTIMGFDEINKLNDANSSSGSGGGGSGGGGSDSVNVEDMFEEVPIDNKVKEWLNELKPYIDRIKDAWDRVKTSIKDLVNSEGFKYLISTTFKEVLKTIATLMGSFADTVDAFKDALNDPVIKSKIDDVKLAWDRVLQSIKNLTSSPAWESVVEATTFIGLTTIEGILNTISGLIDTIKKSIEDLDKNGKIEALKKAWEDVTGAISNLVHSEGFQTLVSTVIDMGVTALSGAFETIASIINNVVVPALDDLKDNGTFKDISDAWAEIWEHIQSIAESEAFKTLVSDTVKVTIESIAVAMQTIADALEVIDGILSSDLEKTLKGIGGIIIDALEIPGKIVMTITDKINELRGQKTNNYGAWESVVNAYRYGLDNNVPYMDAYEITGGINLDTGAEYYPELTLSQFYDKAMELKNAWAELPDSEKSLPFVAYLADNAREVANWYKTKPWEDAPEEEKELAFKAFINSLPKSIANKYRTRSWDTLADSDRMLAWAAYISTKGETVADKYVKDEWKQTNADKRSLYFNAGIETTGAAVASDMINVKWKAVNAKDKILPFTSEITTTAQSMANKKTTDWSGLGSDTKKLPFWSLISTTASSMASNMTGSNGWGGLSEASKKLPFTSAISTSASSMWSTMSTAWKQISTVLPIGSKFTEGAEGDSTSTSSLWGMWNKLVAWFKDDVDIFGYWNVGDKGDSTSTSSLWGMWNKLVNWFRDDVDVYGTWAKGNGVDTLYSMWKAFKDYMNGVSFNAIAYVDPVLTGSVSDYSTGGSGGHYTKFTGGIVNAASGRLFDSAQMFMARENGIPEYVGRFGSHSAVANNYQIVTGIAQGVSAAMVSQNELLREQNSLLREIASKSGNTSVSSILGAMNRVNKRTGTPVVQMG